MTEINKRLSWEEYKNLYRGEERYFTLSTGKELVKFYQLKGKEILSQ